MASGQRLDRRCKGQRAHPQDTLPAGLAHALVQRLAAAPHGQIPPVMQCTGCPSGDTEWSARGQQAHIAFHSTLQHLRCCILGMQQASAACL